MYFKEHNKFKNTQASNTSEDIEEPSAFKNGITKMEKRKDSIN
jgi:hypothetical protein